MDRHAIETKRKQKLDEIKIYLKSNSQEYLKGTVHLLLSRGRKDINNNLINERSQTLKPNFTEFSEYFQLKFTKTLKNTPVKQSGYNQTIAKIDKLLTDCCRKVSKT